MATGGQGKEKHNSQDSYPEKINTSTARLTGKYIFRLLLTAGIFLFLGIFLHMSSQGFGLADPSDILTAGSLSLTTIYILTGLALSLVANIAIHFIKPSVSDTLSCKVITSAEDAIKILKASEADSKRFSKALSAYIEDAKALLDPKSDWKKSLIHYSDDTKEQINADFEALSSSSPDKITLQKIFTRLANAKIDPTYKPSNDNKSLHASILILLYLGCAFILSLIFKQEISSSTLGSLGSWTSLGAWLLILAGSLAVLSTIGTYHLLKNSRGGAYAELAAISALPFMTVLIPCALGVLTPYALLTVIPFAFFSFFAARHAKSALYFANDRSEERSKSSHRAHEFAKKTSLFIKVFTFFTLLLSAFASIALMLNLDGLGFLLGPSADNLLSFAKNIAAGLASNSVGSQWLSISPVIIFLISSVFAFELLQNILKRSPATAAEFKEPNHFILLGGLLLKLSFTVAPILTLMAAFYSNFPPEATLPMLPVFLIVLLVMPLFSGNSNLPFLKSFNRKFNSLFGLYYEPSKKFWSKELNVALIYLSLPALSLLPGIPTWIALPILGVSAAMSLSFRWGTIAWHYFKDQRTLAKNYFQSASIEMPNTASMEDENRNRPGHALEEKKVEPTPIESKKTDPKPATSYFNIQKPSNPKLPIAADLSMQSYFFSSLFASAAAEAFTHPVYNTIWNFVDGLGSFPGIAVNYKKNKLEEDAWEEFVMVFEGMVATFLVATNILSTIAQQEPDSFGSNNALIATLSSYGFALSMTASAVRAMKDTWFAHKELSPRYLLDDRLEKSRKIIKEITEIEETLLALPSDELLLQKKHALEKEKAQLLQEALAIARTKSTEILEGSENMESIFRDLAIGEQLTTLPTKEETLFVNTLLRDNREKFKATSINFFGYLFATLCFWPLALSPVVPGGITLASFGNMVHFSLIAGGMIKFYQILKTVVPFFYEQYRQLDKKMRKEFLDEHAKNIVGILPPPEIKTDIPSSEPAEPEGNNGNVLQVLSNFFSDKNISDNEKAQYIMAYALRRSKLSDDQTTKFLTNIYESSEKPALLGAAQDEFVILLNNNYSPAELGAAEDVGSIDLPNKNRSGDVQKLLLNLIDNQNIKKTQLTENVEFREKAVHSIFENNPGFFKPKPISVSLSQRIRAFCCTPGAH